MQPYLTIAEAFEAAVGFKPTITQVQDAELTASSTAICNFSDVGTGKTVVSTLGTLLRTSTEVTLIAVPPILIPQWCTWLTSLNAGIVCRFQGSPTQRDKLPAESSRFIVMSHAIYRDSFARWSKLGLTRQLELIIDEAHAIKNPASKLYKAVSRQPRVAVQLLTGTPTSKPGDCYTYIKTHSPTVYRSVGHFEAIHVANRDIFGQITEWQELALLAERFAANTIKRTKEEVFGYNLAPIYQTVNYDLSPKHLKLYQQLVEEQLLLLPDGDKVDATTATRLYHALQQIICNHAEFSGDVSDRSAIYDLVDSVVEQTDCLNPTKSKLIIFTHYKRTSRNLLQYLGHQAVGAYSEVNSAKSIERFLTDPTCRILVGQPSSCGVGLNPAHLCSEVLFVEASTVPLLMEQSIGRVDRKGQRVRPTIRFASANGTIQQRLYDQLLKKADLVATVEKRKSLRDSLLGA